MTKTVDFSKVPVEYRFGEPEEMDIRHTVGNAINQGTSDIGVMDFARKVYYSEEPVEIPVEYVNDVLSGITGSKTMLAAAKVAAVKLVKETLGPIPAVSPEEKEVKPNN